MENGRRPWWADDPEIAAIRRRVEEELECASRVPITPDEPDPVDDFWSGASLRELAAARDGLTSARARYEDALCVLGVSKQLLRLEHWTRYGRTVFINMTL
jgi:hypothetical protein